MPLETWLKSFVNMFFDGDSGLYLPYFLRFIAFIELRVAALRDSTILTAPICFKRVSSIGMFSYLTLRF